LGSIKSYRGRQYKPKGTFWGKKEKKVPVRSKKGKSMAARRRGAHCMDGAGKKTEKKKERGEISSKRRLKNVHRAEWAAKKRWKGGTKLVVDGGGGILPPGGSPKKGKARTFLGVKEVRRNQKMSNERKITRKKGAG